MTGAFWRVPASEQDRVIRQPCRASNIGIMKLCPILLVLCGLGLAQAPSQRLPAKKSAAPKPEAPAAAPAKWPVESIIVEGLRNYTREQVIQVTGLKSGQLAGKAEFETARDRLVASGAFETVGYKFEPGPAKQGYVATFQVTEVDPLFPVHFEELGVPDAQLDAVLRTRDPLYSRTKLPATKVVVDRYTAWIQEFLASKGLTEKIAGKVTPVTSDEFAIVFRPARNLPAVAHVTVQGNQVIPQGVLREAIHGTGIGSAYTEAGFREVLNNAVRPLYEQRGRVRVAFPEIRAEPVEDGAGGPVFARGDRGGGERTGRKDEPRAT